MDQQKLKLFVEQNPKLVKMTESLIYPGLYVLKYTRRVFYDNLWCDELEHCRGTIVDRDFNLIAYPFQKIYNLGIESRAPVVDDQAQLTAFRKVNGFMVSVSYWKGDVLVSTTGSTSSDYVDMARELMVKHMPWTDWQIALSGDEYRDMTFMFEACHPQDPHIVPEKPGMYMLGYREKAWGSTVGHDPFVLKDLGRMFNCHVPESVSTNLSRLKDMVKECRHEGFVAYADSGVAFKIKSPYYLVNKWVARNPDTKKLVDLKNDIKKSIDEEYHGLIDAIRLNIKEYTAMDEQARLSWVRTQFNGT